MAPEISLIDPDVYQRSGPPHEMFAWLRAHDPVFWHADGGEPGWPGFWAITRHADIGYLSRHPEIFSSARRLSLFGEIPEDHIELQRLMMLNMDPPQHTRQRAFVNRGFTPRMIGRLENQIAEICEALLDEVQDSGSADFVTEIAAPLPLWVICELVGAPVEDRGRLFELSNLLIGSADPEFQIGPQAQRNAAAEVYAYGAALAERRRAEPADDIITRLLQPDENGEALTSDEFDLFFLLLTVAGNETTRNAAAGGMLALFEHPEQWQRLLVCFTVGSIRIISLNNDDVCRQDGGFSAFRRDHIPTYVPNGDNPYINGYSSGQQQQWLERELRRAASPATLTGSSCACTRCPCHRPISTAPTWGSGGHGYRCSTSTVSTWWWPAMSTISSARSRSAAFCRAARC